MSLWVLSEATHWRLWFLSRTSALAMHHPSWCPTGRKTKNTSVSSFSICCARWYSQTWFISATTSCWLDQHTIAPAAHVVDYSGIHEAGYFSSKRWLCWNLPLRTKGQRPESQALFAHAKHATAVSFLRRSFTGGSGHSAVPRLSLFPSTIHSPDGAERRVSPWKNPGHLMKTDDRSVIRATHSSHLYS